MSRAKDFYRTMKRILRRVQSGHPLIIEAAYTPGGGPKVRLYAKPEEAFISLKEALDLAQSWDFAEPTNPIPVDLRGGAPVRVQILRPFVRDLRSAVRAAEALARDARSAQP